MSGINLRLDDDAAEASYDTKTIAIGEVVVTLKKLKVTEDSLIILKGDDIDEDFLEDLASSLRERDLQCIIVHLPNDGKVELIPDYMMARYGWVRDKNFKKDNSAPEPATDLS